MNRKIIAALAAVAVIALAMACATASGAGTAASAKELCPPEIKGEALYIPFPVKITLDGKLDDWAGIPMAFVDRGSPPSKDPAEDGSFQVAAASDGDRLYVAMTVKDKNIISGQHKTDWWNEDSAEFYVNLGKDLAAEKYTKDACQINIKPVDIGRADAPALTITGTNADKFKVEGVVFKTADGWGFEAALALADRATPAHGREIGFQAQLNGAAAKDRNVKLIWSLADTGDNSWQNPSLFGRGIFYKVGSADVPLPSKIAAAPAAPAAPTAADLSFNQLGYAARGPKFAALAREAAGPLDWVLSDAASGKEVARGTTMAAFKDPLSGDTLHRADFSAFTAPGSYKIAIGGVASEAFVVGDDVYAGLARDALHYFFMTRSGVALTEELAGKAWARPAGHLSDADVRAFAGADAQGKVWKGFPFKIDGSGGWYDAGDFGKYVVNGGISVWTLQDAYERAPKAFPDGAEAIPERANGVPDILDEARWELDFMLRLQIPAGDPLAGVVFLKLHDRTWSGVPSPLPTTMDNNNDMKDGASWGRYVYEPSTAATLNLAACAAQAARLWGAYDRAFADRCLAAAETAWKAALANPALIAGNVPGNGGGNYDDADVQDEFYWAACELYATTGKAEYDAYLRASKFFNAFEGSESGSSSMFWGGTSALGSITLAVAESALPAADRERVRGLIVKAAARYAAMQAADGYATPMDKGGFVWGSNSGALNNALVMALAYDFTGDASYLAATARAMDYILGHNALRKSFVSGYGKFSLAHPHHRLWADDPDSGYPPPPPGVVCGGPNADIQDTVMEKLGLAKLPVPRRYADDIGSFATNEVAINWNAPLAWVAAFLSQAYGK